MTTLLLQQNVFAPDARIVQTGSITQYFPPHRPDPSDLNSEDWSGHLQEGDVMNVYQSFVLYGRAKGLQALWTDLLQKELARSERWKDIVVLCGNPGKASNPSAIPITFLRMLFRITRLGRHGLLDARPRRHPLEPSTQSRALAQQHRRRPRSLRSRNPPLPRRVVRNTETPGKVL